MRKSIRNLWKNERGSSMISVLVAFVILLIGIAGFYTSVRVARNMINWAQNLNNATAVAMEKFYTEAGYNDYTTKAKDITMTDADGKSFLLYGEGKTTQLSVSPTETGKSDPISFRINYYLAPYN